MPLGRRALLAAGAAAAATRAARAEGQFVILIGARPGAAADRSARALVPFLERHLRGARISVLNHPGESGLAALRALAEAAPSDALFGWVATPTLPARTVDCPNAAALLDRLRLIGAVANEPIALVSAANTGLASAEDIIRRANVDAEAMPLGTPPAGSPPHLAALRLQADAGTTLNIVAFPSAVAARQAALTGDVEAAALALGDAIEALRDDSLASLLLPAAIHRGLAAPAGIDDALAATFASALQEVAADPDFRAETEADGVIAAWLGGSDWTTQARLERADLARLWQANPWRPSAIL